MLVLLAEAIEQATFFLFPSPLTIQPTIKLPIFFHIINNNSLEKTMSKALQSEAVDTILSYKNIKGKEKPLKTLTFLYCQMH